jgi:hypothetical protein
MNRAIHPPGPVIAMVWDTAGLHLDIVVSLSTSDSLPPIMTVRLKLVLCGLLRLIGLCMWGGPAHANIYVLSVLALI